jgi:hypothetical protein
MDGERFDSLIKRLGTTRLTRLTALRGLAAGSVAALTGLNLFAEEADANGKKRRRRRRICHRTSATDPGVNKKLKAKRAKRHLRKHPFDTKGACTAAPVGCQNNANCTGGQVCVNNICVNCTFDSQCGGGLFCVNGRCQARVGCSPANNTQGNCPAGQICNTLAICVAGCTGTGQGTCPAGLNCVNGQCQPPGGCTPTNNTQGNCAPGQVCNIFGICVPAVGCLNVANPQCSGSQVCCPSETQRAGECRGNLQSC